jgi:hypothetical protein
MIGKFEGILRILATRNGDVASHEDGVGEPRDLCVKAPPEEQPGLYN